MLTPGTWDYENAATAVVGVRITDRELVECLAGRIETADWEETGQLLAEVFFRGYALHLQPRIEDDPNPYDNFVQIGWPCIMREMWKHIDKSAAACGQKVQHD